MSEQHLKSSVQVSNAGAVGPLKEVATAANTTKTALGGVQGATRETSTEFSALERDAKAAAAAALALAGAQNRVTQSSGQTRASTAQLGQQIGDITQGMAAGTPIATIFAQQAGQVAFALQGMGGVAGTVGTYLSGPWGALVLGAVTILGSMATAFFNTGESAKKAGDGLDEFAKRQSNIANFIDTATGALKEQNATLIRNAILTRQDTIDKNKAEIAEGTAAAIKGLRKPGRGVEQVNAAGTGLTTKFFDPDIAAAVKSANGDIIKLDEALGKIALRRPDLRGAIREISDAAAATVLKAREDKKAAEEIGILSGQVKANIGANAGLIEKQVALATATTALEKARARYSLVLTEGAGIENAGAAAQQAYRTKLTDAANAVNAAEAAERALRLGRSATTKATTAATKATRELAAAEADRAKLIAGIGDDIDKFFASQAADVRQLENAYDPLTAAARDYREELDRIKGLEVSGAINAAQAATFRAGAAAAQKPVTDAKEAFAEAKKQAAALDQAQSQRYEYLANTFYDAFNGRSGDIWSKFKDLGTRTLAELAAQFVLTGQFNIGGTSAGGLVSSLLGGGSGGGGLLGNSGALSGIATKVGGLLGLGGAAAGAGILSAGAGVGLAASAGTAALAGGAGLLGAGGATIAGLSLGGGALATGGLAAASGVGLASAAGVGGAAIAGGTAAAGGLAAAAAPLLAAAPYVAAALAAGLLIKSLIKKDDWGDASLTTTASGVSIASQRTHGTGRAATDATLADAVSAGLANYASQLGGTIKSGVSIGSIGTNKDSYYYNPTGGGFKAAGTQVFKSAEEAVQAALADALGDGAIIASPATEAALKKYGGDVNKAVAEALKVQGLETLIADQDNPFLAVFRDFERVAAERVKVATDNGFDIVAIEKLNGEARAKLVAQTLAQATGGVKSLLNELQFGSRSAGSLDQRRSALEAERDRLLAAAKNDPSQNDAAANIIRQLLDLSTEAFGKTGASALVREQSISQLQELVSQTEAKLSAAQLSASSDPIVAQMTEMNATGDEQTVLLQQIRDAVANWSTGISGGARDLSNVYARIAV